MESKHTPGPWRIDSGGRIVNDPDHATSERDYQIADPLERNTFAECRANARLIAAAPELLAACEEAAKFCPVYMQDRLRAAIAKARGEGA